MLPREAHVGEFANLIIRSRIQYHIALTMSIKTTKQIKIRMQKQLIHASQYLAEFKLASEQSQFTETM